jgi:photosystem II stability/assembly factor-like uncharacterized protein
MNKKIIIALTVVANVSLFAQKKEVKGAVPEKPFLQKSESFSSLKFRNIGPAVTSGRVIDIAVNPKNTNEWYIAAAAGGVFKTKNAGVTFEPIFDNAGAYSIGCVAIDPSNPNIVWVGSGENNNQRAVGYGDGVYKSEDGGKSFKNVGLPKSEHIGNIAINPNNSDIVYVAAYGPVWSSGGERGIYKTTDGGKSWKQVLNVSENTGFNEVHINPSNPNILYACAHQRRRHEWTYISGGPESGIYKSTNAGETWTKLTNGLPSGDVGRITITIPPRNPEMIYAMCEGRDNKGLYKSSDFGASFDKQSSKATDGNYYQEIFSDPKNSEIIYVMDTYATVSSDGGKSFKALGEKNKHVDNHAIWVNPKNTKHLLVGCDGGLYESFDGAATWRYFTNLPITQFYRVCVDNAKPFYNIYGGTQDNNTLGGPSRTKSASGIINTDWFVTTGGDGFQPRVDPKEPNIIYSESQYGGLVRFDKKTGENVSIKPSEKVGESAYRFNWDAPLIISNFDNKRIYFAGSKVFRSNNRGDSWEVISPDLSRGLDRNKFPVMGKLWSMDAVAKNQSTSIFGNITALTESPKNQDLIYAGTDDGLIQITNDGGKNWTKVENIPGVPQITAGVYKMQPLVNFMLASQHNENKVFAVFNNHRQGDFKPYLMMSLDKGKTWTNIANNLPERGSVYSFAEDTKNENLYFCGTEFGFYFSLDAGKNWVELTSGLPESICIKDIAIQREEDDIVLATFGRGFFVLDNYSILQTIKADDLIKDATIFPIKKGLMYFESTPFGHTGKSFQGASFFNAPNPEIGATIYYHIKNDYKTIKDKRKEIEKEKNKKGESIFYPSADSIRLEDNETAATGFIIITDDKGNEVRKLKASIAKGINRLVWDGHHELSVPINFNVPDIENPYYSPDRGMPAIPGKYFAQLVIIQNGKPSSLTDKIAFEIEALNLNTLPVKDAKVTNEYNKQLSDFRRIVLGTHDYVGGIKEKMKYIKQGINTGNVNAFALLDDVTNLESKLRVYDLKMNGDAALAKREFETLEGLLNGVEEIVYWSWNQSYGATDAHQERLSRLKKDFTTVYADVLEMKSIMEGIEQKADNLKLPATIGRLPKLD